MADGDDEPDAVARWTVHAVAEPNSQYRSEYVALATLFAHACGREAVWREALRGIKMGESEIVKEWKREGRQEGRH